MSLSHDDFSILAGYWSFLLIMLIDIFFLFVFGGRVWSFVDVDLFFVVAVALALGDELLNWLDVYPSY
jgi:hypothetical protein